MAVGSIPTIQSSTVDDLTVAIVKFHYTPFLCLHLPVSLSFSPFNQVPSLSLSITLKKKWTGQQKTLLKNIVVWLQG